MATVLDLMLNIRERVTIFYHKDTNSFDIYPSSPIEKETLTMDSLIPTHDTNNFRLPSYEDIDHKEIFSFFVRECVEDKEMRKQLFYILRRHDYMDDFIDKLHEFDLYDDFELICGDVYNQIFMEWKEENGLDFE